MELCFLRNDGAAHEVFPLAFRRSLLLPYIYSVYFPYMATKKTKNGTENYSTLVAQSEGVNRKSSIR